MSKSIVENIDCMERLREAPDNHWDLAIVDPPYGIGCAQTINIPNKKRGFAGNKLHLSKEWDNQIPVPSYFQELQRVSKNQIIWGGNYFTEFLSPTKSWIVWDKKETKSQGSNFSDVEMAWTSCKMPTRLFQYGWIGIDYCNKNEVKIHPTQKPTALYLWLLTNYAKPGDTILDTHLGSQSSRIAAWDLGFDFTGYELDEDYFKAGCERFNRHIAQGNLFAEPSKVESAVALFE